MTRARVALFVALTVSVTPSLSWAELPAPSASTVPPAPQGTPPLASTAAPATTASGAAPLAPPPVIPPGTVVLPAPSPPAKPNVPPAEPDDRVWLKQVYEQVADSVVLIETELGSGSGFFFYSPRYVATALHVVDDAETIIVNATDGRRWQGRVAAYSKEHDVALVDLGQEADGAHVLPPFRGRVDIGEKVAVIGHPFSGLENSLPRLRGLLNWSLTQGIVGAVAGSWIQTDAAINPGNSGGPVLNARGEVLGVVSAKLTGAQGIGMIARIQRVDDLVPKIGTQAQPRELVAFDGIELGFLVNWADVVIDGFDVGAGIRFAKRYPVNLRFGFLGGDVEPESPTTVATRLERFATEISGGYALPLLDFLEATPNLGVGFFYDRWHNSALRIDGSVPCSDPPCFVDGKVIRTRELEFRVLPMIGLTLDIGRLRASYAYQVDLSGSDRSQHRALFAFHF